MVTTSDSEFIGRFLEFAAAMQLGRATVIRDLDGKQGDTSSQLLELAD